MRLDKYETFIIEKMAETRIPGLSASIIHGGDIVWAQGFGFRDLDHELLATPDTLYAVGSVTKSFTAIAVMQLAEQGKLDLNDPVEKYLPLKIRPQGSPILIWHLLTHTAGIPALGYVENVLRALAETRQPGVSEDMVTFLNEGQDWALTNPGKDWFYLNEGYVLLGLVVEACSGMPYSQYLQENIFEKLGMGNSFFRRELYEASTNRATPYLITDTGERIPGLYPFKAITSDGGLISSVLDLSKAIAMYLNEGALNGIQILTQSAVDQMVTPYITTPLKNGPFGDYRYGFGLGLLPDFFGQILVGHSGSVDVSTAYIGFIPQKNIGVALLANGNGYPLSHLGLYGLAIMIEEDPEQIPIIQNERRLMELEGRYVTYKDALEAKIRRQGDFLVLELLHNKYRTTTIPLVPSALGETQRTFFTFDKGYTINIDFEVQGGNVELVYERYRFRKTQPNII